VQYGTTELERHYHSDSHTSECGAEAFALALFLGDILVCGGWLAMGCHYDTPHSDH
jgi:hypothetical protein